MIGGKSVCRRAVPVLAALGAGAAVCAPVSAERAADEATRAPIEEARRATLELMTQLRGELVAAIESSGPLRAIVVCKYTVPEISSAVSRKYGARVTRVSLRPRNPALGWADAWEQAALLSFEQRAARGEKVDGMEHAEIVAEPAGRFFRYVRALPAAPLCMSCHGAPEQVSEAIRAQIANEYPHDRALGTAVGQLRGAVTFKKPL
jgi:hypothetical protein